MTSSSARCKIRQLTSQFCYEGVYKIEGRVKSESARISYTRSSKIVKHNYSFVVAYFENLQFEMRYLFENINLCTACLRS